MMWACNFIWRSTMDMKFFQYKATSLQKHWKQLFFSRQSEFLFSFVAKKVIADNICRNENSTCRTSKNLPFLAKIVPPKLLTKKTSQFKTFSKHPLLRRVLFQTHDQMVKIVPIPNGLKSGQFQENGLFQESTFKISMVYHSWMKLVI